jgi:hypothetical protein
MSRMNAPVGTGRHAPRPVAVFACAAAGVICITGLALTAMFGGAAARRAVVASGILALAVQVVAYSAARSALVRPARPIMTAWVAGMLLRFGAVVAYALLALRPLMLAPVPALLSFVIFLFVSTLLEPWLLHS